MCGWPDCSAQLREADAAPRAGSASANSRYGFISIHNSMCTERSIDRNADYHLAQIAGGGKNADLREGRRSRRNRPGTNMNARPSGRSTNSSRVGITGVVHSRLRSGMRSAPAWLCARGPVERGRRPDRSVRRDPDTARAGVREQSWNRLQSPEPVRQPVCRPPSTRLWPSGP